MGNRVAVMMIAAAVFAASVCFAQTRAVDAYGAALFEGRPFVTDGGLYNGYDLGGSPLGLFEAEQSRFSAGVGYRYYGIGDASGHYLSGQFLRMGDPGRAFFEVFYGPDIMSNKNSGNTVSLPLQRFGLMGVAQATSGAFRSSIMAEGYIGTQEWERGDSSRTFMGFERLRLDLGSQVHPLVRFSLFFSVNARLDTLRAPSREDVSFQMNFPEFGGNIDFGGEDMPVRSNLYVSYAFSRFIYRANGWGSPSVNGENHADPILNDSLNIFWMAQGRIPVNDDYAVKPGLLFGYTGNSGEMFAPGPDNDLFNLGDARIGSPYDMTGLSFGLGAGFEASKYANVHVEYTLAAMSVEWGNRYTGSAGERSRTLHHTAFGVSSPLHEYLTLPLNITPRAAYFISGSAGVAGVRHLSFEPMNIVSGKSRNYLYNPQYFLEGFERTSGFTFGVDGQALEGRLSVSYWMTFLSRKTVSKGGMELGLSAGFSL